MKTLFIITFLLFGNLYSNAQEQRLAFSQARSVDQYDKVITDWHSEENIFVFNANGGSDIVWTTKTGNTITFSFRKKTTGYSEDGYFYEEYEVFTWNPEFEDEEIVIIRKYTEDGLLILNFWDGKEGFLP